MLTIEKENTQITNNNQPEKEPQELFSLRKFVKKNLLEIVTGTATISLVLFAGSLALVWSNFKANKDLNDKQLKIEKLGNQIIYIDEVLTMSARMAASTSNRAWEIRYNRFEPQLEDALKDFRLLSPQAYKEYSETTEDVNLKLVNLEKKAFDLAAKGKNEAAMNLVLSKEYEQLKKTYTDSFQNTFNQIQAQINDEIVQYNQNFIISISITVISFFFWIISWLGVIILIKNYIKERDLAQKKLLNSQQKLINLNENLELELEKRTTKLKEREKLIQEENELLQDEVSNILEVVSAAEDGDLTVNSDVGSGVTGLVADTLNRFLEELGKVIKTVLNTTTEVNEGAILVEKLSIETANRVQKQVLSLDKIQTLMKEISELSQENLERNQTTYQSFLKSESAVNLGVNTISQMSHGIIILTAESDQILKRLELLEDFVQIASEVVRVQKKVAAKTKVLGLNASMVAERAANEQDPQQFAVFAQEFGTIATQVNNVASLTGESLLTLQQRTERMQTVVSGFNQDIQSINQLAFEFTESVNQTSEVFDQINFEIKQLTIIEKQLTEYSDTIAHAAQTTLKAIQDITTLAKETETQALITQEKSGIMGKLAHQLLAIVNFFKVS